MTDSSRMQTLERTMAEFEATCAGLPDTCQPHIGNAMLNIGLGYLIELHGQRGTASLLARVVDALTTGEMPVSSARAIDPVRLDG
jgi:hypothetical protein